MMDSFFVTIIILILKMWQPRARVTNSLSQLIKDYEYANRRLCQTLLLIPKESVFSGG